MEPNQEPVVEDEAALDQELAASIASVQAGKTIAPEVPVKPEEPAKVEETPAPVAPKVESTSETPSAPVQEEAQPGQPGYEFRVPNKGKFESDESYEKRIELFDLVKRRKAATSPEQKEKLSEQITTAKNQLKTLNGSDRITNPNNGETTVVKPEEDPALTADKERLKQLGGATKEEVQEIIQSQQLVAETKSTLEKFVERHSELKDPDVREVFFDFVDANYNWNGKTGKDLMTVLELARESMFKPSETVQERVLKGANVAEKVNAMQFPGGTAAATTRSPEIQKSIDELKATGMSEEKALELLAD